MKKFMKISLTAAVVLVVFGAVLAGIGGFLGGQEKLNRMSRNILHQDEIYEDADDGWTDELDFDRDFPVLKGDFREKMELPLLRGLELEASGVAVRVKDSEQPEICLEAEGIDKAQFFVEEGTLHVKVYNRQKGNEDDRESVTLYLPSNAAFAETELDIGAAELIMETLRTEELDGKVGAGQIFVEELNAGRTDLEIGMGQMSIQNAEINNLEFEVGMGILIYQGEITGNIDGECGMGSVQMDIKKGYQDFNYNIEAAMGSVKIGDQEFAGLAADQYINNGASQNCELTSSMGNIEIRFDS